VRICNVFADKFADFNVCLFAEQNVKSMYSTVDC
jgi:hypothetical protein